MPGFGHKGLEAHIQSLVVSPGIMVRVTQFPQDCLSISRTAPGSVYKPINSLTPIFQGKGGIRGEVFSKIDLRVQVAALHPLAPKTTRLVLIQWDTPPMIE